MRTFIVFERQRRDRPPTSSVGECAPTVITFWGTGGCNVPIVVEKEHGCETKNLLNLDDEHHCQREEI